MKSKTTNILLGSAILVFATVAILVLFTSMFNYQDDYGAGWGSGFGVIFGTAQNKSFHAVPLLIVAFSIEILGGLLGILSPFFSRKIGMILNIVSAACLIAAGVLFLFSVSLFLGANKDSVELTKLIQNSSGKALTLGAAPITNAVFAFLGGLIGVYGAYSSLQAN